MKIAAIYIYDYIGEGGYSAGDFANDLMQHKENGAEKFHIHINSGGGSVFDGFTIYNLLKKEDVEIYIDGWAASIASLIAMSGKKIFAYKNSFIMIHNPSTFSWGDEKEMERRKTQLEMIKKSIVQAYTDKTGLEESEIVTMMDDETWMSADTALGKGFIDEIIETIEEKNHVAVFSNYIDLGNSNKRNKKMNKDLLNFLGLQEDATEEVITNKVVELKKEFGLEDTATINDVFEKIKENNAPGNNTDLNSLINKIDSLAETVENLTEANEALKKEKKQTDAEKLIENAINDGKILPADKEVWVTNALADFDGTKEKIEARKKHSAMPKAVETTEADEIDVSEFDNKNVDEDKLELHKQAKALMAAENIDYLSAVKKVQKQNN